MTEALRVPNAHGSHHHSAAGASRGRLLIVFSLVVGYLVVEIVGSLLTNSLALLADAGHMLTDAVGVGLALLAIQFATRPASPSKSYGYYRLEILAAVANAVLLFGVAGYILFEAYRRFTDPPAVVSVPMLVIAAVGLVVNGVSMKLLAGGAEKSLNVRGAYLEVMGDLLGSVAVLVAATVILLTGWAYADPIESGRGPLPGNCPCPRGNSGSRFVPFLAMSVVRIGGHFDGWPGIGWVAGRVFLGLQLEQTLSFIWFLEDRALEPLTLPHNSAGRLTTSSEI
jgi:hypothetical protein